MDRFSEDDVRGTLDPFHQRIRSVIESGLAEWLTIKDCMLGHSFGSVLYSRTASNHIFDAVARNAIREFSGDSAVHVKEEAQTVKFCFNNVVIARFKKGDDDNLGQNHPTQAALSFVDPQQSLPGFPPAASKVEFVWTITVLEDGIEEVLVVARDGDRMLWSYPIEEEAPASSGSVEMFPDPDPEPDPDDEDDDIVVPRTDDRDEAEGD